MHLVLVARRRHLLEELAGELHTRHGAKCEVIDADLSDPDQPGRVIDEIDGRGIAVELLINNAGFGIVGEVDDTDVERTMAMLRLNVGALTELTHRVLPGMLERGHGAIVNLSSVSGFQPVAYMPAYAASKAYVLHFSEALWAETHDRGVTVMALCPGVTQTEFFETAGVPNWLKKQRSQSPAQVVKQALKSLEKGRQYVIPGWHNYLRSLIVRLGTRQRVVTESMKYFRPRRKSGKEKRAEAVERSDDEPSARSR